MLSDAVARLFLLLVAITLPISAPQAVELFDSEKSVQINKQARIFRISSVDPTLSIFDVVRLKDQFQWASDSNPNYGFSQQAIWFYVELSNRSNVDEWVVDVAFAQNQEVDFFLLAGDELIASSSQGSARIGQAHRIPSFSANLTFGLNYQLYIRVKSPVQALVAPINISPKVTFSRSMAADNMWWGMFYGGLIILSFYNLVLFFITREWSLLAYIGYIGAALLWQFVWGGHSQLIVSQSVNHWLSNHISLLFLLVGLGAGLFTLTFLNAKQTAPKSRHAIVVAMSASGLLLLLTLSQLLPVSLQNTMVYGVSMLAICTYLMAGFESYFNNFKPAQYFVVAWSVLLMAAMLGMLGLVGFIPSNNFTTYCFQVGVFIEAALFSVALIEKTRHKMENDASAITDDLVNNMQIIEEQNIHLDIARKEAIKASNIKSQFLANMSHEIRTPLNAIIGFSQELSKLNLALEPQEHVQIIHQSATNLLAIVNEVLDFSKIEAGKLQINEEAFSPGDLLEELVFVFAKAAQKKQLTFYYEQCPLPKKLMTDGARVKQVLTNLLSNAVKFTNSGSVALSVSTQVVKGDTIEWVIKVEDTGIGIATEDKARLFQSFSQLDDSLNRSYQGTGLGLVISQQLVKLMHGTINFSSTHGVGSCFQVMLPCQRVTRLLDLEENQQWQGKKVLLLDSNPRSRLISAKILHCLGAHVTSGTSFTWLQEQYEEFDYFFTDEQTLSRCKDAVVARLVRILDVRERVLLVDANGSPSGPFSEHFERLIESPLLVSRLKSFQQEQEKNSNNIWNERLLKLPAVNILAVDDMPINLRLLTTWLQDSPIELQLCYSGAEAVQQCQENEFDLILMDVQMPDMDGLQTTQLIRKSPLNQGTPVIAVTAHAFKEEQEKLLNSGMDDYLPKPLELGALLNVIQRWCSSPENNVTALNDVDWDLALSKANHNEAIAQEMLQEFSKQLPESLIAIEQACRIQNWEVMQQQVHRLHGASCYTGVPKLQQLCAEIETELKEGFVDEAHRKFPELKTAIESLLAL